jgi:hypothetical protein
MPASFWIFLIVCIFTFIPVCRDHGKTWREFKSSRDKKERWRNGLLFFLLWGIPILTTFGTLVTGRESIASNREAKTQSDQFVAQSTLLAQTKSKATELEKSLKETQQQLGEAKALTTRIAEAQVERSDLINWQSLEEELRSVLLPPGYSIQLWASGGNDEALRVQQRMLASFGRGGLKATGVRSLADDPMEAGITISAPGTSVGKVLVELFTKAFSRAGIDLMHENPGVDSSLTSTKAKTPNVIVIHIGSKPPPK